MFECPLLTPRSIVPGMWAMVRLGVLLRLRRTRPLRSNGFTRWVLTRWLIRSDKPAGPAVSLPTTGNSLCSFNFEFLPSQFRVPLDAHSGNGQHVGVPV